MSGTVAVMQPYFFPYAGYCQLMREADVFVIYDCVQFPRRGYVHRNRLRRRDGVLDWITLPLAKASRDVKIIDLEFSDNAVEIFEERVRKFPCFSPESLIKTPSELKELIFNFNQPATSYLESSLRYVARCIDAKCKFVRSSAFEVPGELKGQERVLEIVKRVGAKRYVNASGGVDLYDPARFASLGVELSFLKRYQGDPVSILETLLTGGVPRV